MCAVGNWEMCGTIVRDSSVMFSNSLEQTGVLQSCDMSNRLLEICVCQFTISLTIQDMKCLQLQRARVRLCREARTSEYLSVFVRGPSQFHSASTPIRSDEFYHLAFHGLLCHRGLEWRIGFPWRFVGSVVRRFAADETNL